MKIFKKYIFFVAAIFLVGLFFPGQNLLAAVDSCVCYEGDFELSRFTASQKSICSARCATLPSVTAFSFGDDSSKVAVKNDAGKSGSTCLCSFDSINTTGAVISGVTSIGSAVVTGGATSGFFINDWVSKNLQHPAVSVGKFTSSDTCEQTCANGNYKSFVLGNNFLTNVTYPKISVNTKFEGAQMDTSVYGTTEASGIVQCGRPGHEMCTLCDLIKGFYDIIQYIIKIAVVVALAMFTLGGSSYVTSFGGEKEIEMAKAAMKNAVIGLTIILAAWLLVNTVFLILGASPNLGVSQASSWWQFECSAGGK